MGSGGINNGCEYLVRGALALAQPRQVRRRIGSPALGSSATSQSAAGGSSGSIGCHQCEQSAATRFPLFGLPPVPPVRASFFSSEG